MKGVIYRQANPPEVFEVRQNLYRLEEKKIVRRVRKIGNAHIFEAAVTRDSAHRKLIDEFLALFGGRTQPVLARFIESGKLTMDDVREAERTIQRLSRKNKKGKS